MDEPIQIEARPRTDSPRRRLDLAWTEATDAEHTAFVEGPVRAWLRTRLAWKVEP